MSLSDGLEATEGTGDRLRSIAVTCRLCGSESIRLSPVRVRYPEPVLCIRFTCTKCGAGDELFCRQQRAAS